MAVGLLLTMMAVNLERKDDAPLPLALPVCLLFLPILDTAAAIIRRKLAGLPKTKKLSPVEEREVNLASYSKLEPLISELIGAHSLRMDALGLTA